MRKHLGSPAAGALMVAVGLVLFFVFADVETPVVGLRQLGAVLAVLGVVELVVSAFAVRRQSA